MNHMLNLINTVPEYGLALLVYFVSATAVLWGWWVISHRLNSKLRLSLTFILFSLLYTPTVSEGTNAALAPAICAFIFGLLTKESALIWVNLALIFICCSICFLIYFCWQYYRKLNAAQ